jgi:hypothetical protein
MERDRGREGRASANFRECKNLHLDLAVGFNTNGQPVC